MELNDWMAANKVSDDDIADKIGVSRSYVSRVRRGLANNISLKVALDIWQVTGKTVDLNSMLFSHDREDFRRRWRLTGISRKKPAPKVSRSPEAA